MFLGNLVIDSCLFSFIDYLLILLMPYKGYAQSSQLFVAPCGGQVESTSLFHEKLPPLLASYVATLHKYFINLEATRALVNDGGINIVSHLSLLIFHYAN